jgi:hypothetical protein
MLYRTARACLDPAPKSLLFLEDRRPIFDCVGSSFAMFHHLVHLGGAPPPPRVHFAYPNGSPILNAKYARRKYGRSAQSGRMTAFFWSSRRPRWSNRTLRDLSCRTSPAAFHDSSSSSGASNSFWTSSE